jgi:hypothetical protein
MKYVNLIRQKDLLFTFIIAIVFSSCSMVKSGDANNFNRVKYHPHIKGVKLTKTEKIEKSDAPEISQAEIEKFESKKLERTTIGEDQLAIEESNFNPFERKNDKQKTVKLNKNNSKVDADKETALNDFSPFLGLKGWSSLKDLIPSKKPILAAPAVDDDSAISGLIWLLLVILLVLVILSILANLGGGVIGTLVAVLLILLILSLLGVI